MESKLHVRSLSEVHPGGRMKVKEKSQGEVEESPSMSGEG